MVLEGCPRNWKMEDAMEQGTHLYHRQVNKTQKKQSRAMVLNGKSTSFSYPMAEFWRWNNRITLKPTRVNTARMWAVYDVGFPSVYQTSEHLRFDLVERPRVVNRGTAQRLGVGHTARASKHVWNHVWSVFYKFQSQMFTSKFGVGQAVLRYWMTVISTVFIPRDPPAVWSVSVKVPDGWDTDANVQAYFQRKPDKYDFIKLELNCFFHILLTEVRFPGEVPEEARNVLVRAMESHLVALVARVQQHCTEKLRERLLDIIGYHETCVKHLKRQQGLCGEKMASVNRPSLSDVKIMELPAGHDLQAEVSSDEDDTDDEGALVEPRMTATYRLSWKPKPRPKRKLRVLEAEAASHASERGPGLVEHKLPRMGAVSTGTVADTVPSFDETRELSELELIRLSVGDVVLYDYDATQVLYVAKVQKVHRRTIVLYFAEDDTEVTLQKDSNAFLHNIRVRV